MDAKLAEVLARLVARSGGSLLKTQAVKLPYLVDVVAENALGQRVTSATHQTWEYGVVSREVWTFITYAENKPPFRVCSHRYSEGGQLVSLTEDVACDVELLTTDEAAIVDLVAELYGSMPAERLALLTKALNPQVPPDEWGQNHEAETGEDAYARLLSPAWISFWEQLPTLDLTDESQWGPNIEDPADYVRQAFGG